MIAEAPGKRPSYLSVTSMLLGANIVIWLAVTFIAGRGHLLQTFSDGPDVVALTNAGATVSERIFAHGEYWRLISACFLHAGLLHIAFNGWALWVFGPHLEKALGKGRYLLLYLLCGIGGSYLSARMNPGVVGVGASGAIFGLVGTLWSALKRRGAPPEAMREIVWIVCLNFAFGLRPGSHIDNWAHTGGLLSGLLLGFLIPDRARSGKAAGRALDRIGWAVSAVLLAYGLGFGGRSAFFNLVRPDLAPLRVEASRSGQFSIAVPDGWTRAADEPWDLWRSPGGSLPVLLVREIPPAAAAMIVSQQAAIAYASMLAQSIVGEEGGNRLSLSGGSRILDGRRALRFQGVARPPGMGTVRLTLYWIEEGQHRFAVAMVAPDDSAAAASGGSGTPTPLLDRMAGR